MPLYTGLPCVSSSFSLTARRALSILCSTLGALVPNIRATYFELSNILNCLQRYFMKRPLSSRVTYTNVLTLSHYDAKAPTFCFRTWHARMPCFRYATRYTYFAIVRCIVLFYTAILTWRWYESIMYNFFVSYWNLNVWSMAVCGFNRGSIRRSYSLNNQTRSTHRIDENLTMKFTTLRIGIGNWLERGISNWRETRTAILNLYLYFLLLFSGYIHSKITRGRVKWSISNFLCHDY